jgi:hypothetical protein
LFAWFDVSSGLYPDFSFVEHKATVLELFSFCLINCSARAGIKEEGIYQYLLPRARHFNGIGTIRRGQVRVVEDGT